MFKALLLVGFVWNVGLRHVVMRVWLRTVLSQTRQEGRFQGLLYCIGTGLCLYDIQYTPHDITACYCTVLAPEQDIRPPNRCFAPILSVKVHVTSYDSLTSLTQLTVTGYCSLLYSTVSKNDQYSRLFYDLFINTTIRVQYHTTIQQSNLV